MQPEMLPGNFQFRMSHGGASVDQTQDITANPTVVFQTVNVTVQLHDSTGSPLDVGVVQYYAGGWQDFGSTSGGQVSRELLPGNLQFRMSYGGASVDLTQDIAVNPTVVFQTGQVISDTGTCTHYYAGGWQSFVSGMELLPGTYNFRFNDETPDTPYTIVGGNINHIH